MEHMGGGLEYCGVFVPTPDGHANVATLASPSDRYEEIHDEVLPVLWTLNATDTS
jgi:hypothetical protein